VPQQFRFSGRNGSRSKQPADANKKSAPAGAANKKKRNDP